MLHLEDFAAYTTCQLRVYRFLMTREFLLRTFCYQEFFTCNILKEHTVFVYGFSLSYTFHMVNVFKHIFICFFHFFYYCLEKCAGIKAAVAFRNTYTTTRPKRHFFEGAARSHIHCIFSTIHHPAAAQCVPILKFPQSFRCSQCPDAVLWPFTPPQPRAIIHNLSVELGVKELG